MEYLFKSILILLIFLLVHRLFLQQEALHRFNRYYLLSAILLSFLIPLNTIEVAVDTGVSAAQATNNFQEEVFLPEHNLPLESIHETPTKEKGMNWESLILYVYAFGCMLMLIRFCFHIGIIWNKISKNLHVTYRGETLVLLRENSLPYSFMKFIFVNKSDFQENGISDPVLLHEIAHVEERHTLDILFIEILLILFWFNPGLYWAKGLIQLNHEFIADKEALKKTDLATYQQLLLNHLQVSTSKSLVSGFGFSITKKRLQMMGKKTKPTIQILKVALLIPLLGALVFGFSEKIYVSESIESEDLESDSIDNYVKNELSVLLLGNGNVEVANVILDEDEFGAFLDDNPQITYVKISAAPTLKMGVISDFQALLRENEVYEISYQDPVNDDNQKYQEIDKKTFFAETTFLIKYPDGKISKVSYEELSEELREDLLVPKISADRKAPTEENLNTWESSDNHALWLDGKVISNAALANLDQVKIYHFFESFVYQNARSEKFPQEYQVSLYSKAAFEEMINEVKSGPAEMHILLNSPPDTVYVQEVQNSEKVEKYRRDVEAYHESLEDGEHFVFRSKDEKVEILEAWSDLGGRYFKLSSADKKKVARPQSPYPPFVRLEKDGEVYYKLREEMTQEEIDRLPPPPPPMKVSDSLPPPPPPPVQNHESDLPAPPAPEPPVRAKDAKQPVPPVPPIKKEGN